MHDFLSYNFWLILWVLILLIWAALALRTLHFMEKGIGDLKGHKAMLLVVSGGPLFILIIAVMFAVNGVPAAFANFLERDDVSNS